MATSGALFPSLVPGSRGASSKYLVEFRAGKMSLKGTTVTPDKRKGLVYIQQTDDSLIHFCWKDRTSGNVEDVSVPEPQQRDRRLLGSSRWGLGRIWGPFVGPSSAALLMGRPGLRAGAGPCPCPHAQPLQEPKTDQDEEHCRKVNEYLNNPPMPGALGATLCTRR
ncbi:adhesion regulating molecule 1 [Saguinus oedipus]|uniref:Adhesion regulating molecule 1 n=1 Tax=Saguinus oedipus TaxID=9490 RepID=A0ABQ9VM79_SAGOE|nr:adhesion regulating molecule 1 [Saguinus oedipus]